MKRVLYDYKKRVFWLEKTGELLEIPYVENFMVSLKKLQEAKDKIRRRNLQIKELKKELHCYGCGARFNHHYCNSCVEKMPKED